MGRRDRDSKIGKLAGGVAALWALGGIAKLGLAAGAVAGGYVVARKLVRSTGGRASTGRPLDPAFI